MPYHSHSTQLLIIIALKRKSIMINILYLKLSYPTICISNYTYEQNLRNNCSFFSGIKACEKLLNVSNANLHKWCAILVGVHGDFLPITEKIKNGYRFKELVMEALEISPHDADLHYLLGRFKYEVASLSWIERRVCVSVVF